LCAEKQGAIIQGDIPASVGIFTTTRPVNVASKETAFAENWSQATTYRLNLIDSAHSI
jgi:hypothetical protein